MKRTLTLLTLLLALLALLVLPAAAADLPRLVDNADLLMADDAEALLADLDSRSEALQFDIVIVTVDSLDGETPRNYAEDFFWYNNYGLGHGHARLVHRHAWLRHHRHHARRARGHGGPLPAPALER